MGADPEHSFVSRGGLKLAAALDAFGLDVNGLICADLGCSTGGFTDCLLQRGAGHVYAVDTAYGAFAWKLRQDSRVTLLERTNAIHLDTPPVPRLDLVVIDLGWTRQSRAIPAALRWGPVNIVTLIKPHYEAERRPARGGVLDDAEAQSIARRVAESLPAMGCEVRGMIPSPILGGGSRKGRGNQEFLAWLQVSDGVGRQRAAPVG